MTENFQNEILKSGYIHRLLTPDKTRSSEARLLKKKILKSRALWKDNANSEWEKIGEGEMKVSNEILELKIPARKEFDEQMPRYWGYGLIKAALTFPQGDDWRGYNRLRCKIKPRRNGLHAQVATMYLVNDGEIKIPDRYEREGAFWTNLQNDEWNDVVWEFPDLPRDKITEVAFEITAFGKEKGGADNLEFEIKDIFLDEVENPDVSLGWGSALGTVCYSTSGYFADGRKQAIVSSCEGDFEVLHESDEIILSGSVKKLSNEKGSFGIIDFSEITEPGYYRLRVNETITEIFPISKNPYDEAIWKAINFIYAERCGYPVNGGHGFCHGDYIAEHNGQRMIFCGGWHDAADLSQQTLQTGEVAHALYEIALRTDDLQLYNRLMEEANWGLDFVLRTRFGDGYRATGLGCCRWTDQYIGTNDDEKARVHNRSFDNFLMGGIEAYGAFALKAYDADKAFVALKAAKEDYAFALERFEKIGCEEGQMMEHTFNAHEAQYFAAASWCASMIFKACDEEYYANEAARFGALLLECQDTGETGTAFSGFFYRDRNKKTITHFNHQAREHIFPQALAALCETQPRASAINFWREGLRKHGEYLKKIFTYAAPYGMFPAGLHAFSEAEDSETFHFLHVRTDFNEEKSNYLKQLQSGIRVDENHCIKQFPVWFSFRGNSAVILSSGKAASIIGRALGDDELIEIARDQLYWHSGKNPFGQSLMYGEGNNYPQQYALLLGETVGEMPVGVQTWENEDVPYWPMANQATYKEVWMSTVGHWLWVIADMGEKKCL
jgi:hypothetical protein